MKKVLIIVFVGFLILLLFAGGASLYALQPPDKGNLIVYGSKTCPWCIKQEDYLMKAGIPYSFVDCQKGGCPDFVSGFPTLNLNGKIMNGYTELGPELTYPAPALTST